MKYIFLEIETLEVNWRCAFQKVLKKKSNPYVLIESES